MAEQLDTDGIVERFISPDYTRKIFTLFLTSSNVQARRV